MSTKFEIWAEGYRVTGNEAGATLLGVAEGPDFKAAVLAHAQTDLAFRNHLDTDRLTYWGCRLFPLEADARKSFG